MALFFHRMTGLRLLIVLLAASLTGAAGGAEDPAGDALRYRIDSLSALVTRSMDGRFVAVGDDRSKSSDLLEWCNQIARSFEARTSLPLSFVDRTITVMVLPNLRQERRVGAWIDPVGDGVLGKEIKQRLWVDDYADVAGIDTERLLTTLLLSTWRENRQWHAVPIPAWLVRGVHRSLLPATRALDIELTLDRWQQGQLAGLQSYLAAWSAAPLAPPRTAAPGDPLETAVVTWLQESLGERFLPLLRQACQSTGPARQPVGMLQVIDWLGARDGADVDMRWEQWLLGRRHTVVILGAVTRRHLRDYQAELLLYPGSCAIPPSERVGPGVGFDQLTALRSRPWIADFCRVKQARLRALAAGRGEELLHVSALYDTFLKALRFSDSDEEIEQARVAAESAFKALWRALPALSDNGQEGR